jgi:hypothetical protein
MPSRKLSAHHVQFFTAEEHASPQPVRETSIKDYSDAIAPANQCDTTAV